MPDTTPTDVQPTVPPLLMERAFTAPPTLVFRAWSSAEHMKRWFSPKGFTVPVAEIDFRRDGACAICMRSPDGQEFWNRGRYLDIVPDERLTFSGTMGEGEARKFTARTTVTFVAEGTGTRLAVRQDYDIHDPAAAPMLAGAEEGWRQTLDKLEQEVDRIAAGG